MKKLTDIDPYDESGHVRVVVETPAGSRLKLKYDPGIDAFTWSRKLAAGVTYPFDYGFVPQTLSGDGDGLDALVYADVASIPGVVVAGRVIGALLVEQKRDGQGAKRNDRLIVVPAFDQNASHTANVSELPNRVRDELEAFFRASLVLTGKQANVIGWADADDAEELLQQAIERYAGAGGDQA